MQSIRVPKYYIVKRAIIDKIDNEEFQGSEMIPSERELMAMFQVSRITVRKAVEELEQEGYLFKVQGKGTYIKGDQNSQDLFSITSCTQDVIRLGMTPTRKVVSASLIPADKKRQRLLNLTGEDKVFQLMRVYYADGEPINYTTTYLPQRYFPSLEKYDFSSDSLYDTLESVYGVSLTHATRTIEAILAHDDIAEYLDVEDGVPLLLFQCVTMGVVNGKEVPVETLKCSYRSDKFKFYINQAGRGKPHGI